MLKRHDLVSNIGRSDNRRNGKHFCGVKVKKNYGNEMNKEMIQETAVCKTIKKREKLKLQSLCFETSDEKNEIQNKCFRQQLSVTRTFLFNFSLFEGRIQRCPKVQEVSSL